MMLKTGPFEDYWAGPAISGAARLALPLQALLAYAWLTRSNAWGCGLLAELHARRSWSIAKAHEW